MGTKIAIEGSGLAWDNNASWVGGTKPTDADDIILPGFHEFTSSLTTALNYASILVAKGARVRFGGPLTAAVNNSGGGIVVLGEMELTLIGATNKAFAMSAGARLTLYSGAQTQIEAHNGGYVTVKSGASFTSGAVRVGRDSGVYIEENGGGDRVDAVTVMARGRLLSRRLIEAGTIMGDLVFEKAGSNSNGSGTGLLTVYDGGRVIHKNDQAVTDDNIKNYGGTVDPRGMAGVYTLTNYHKGANSLLFGASIAGPVVHTNAATSDGVTRDTSAFSPSIPLD